MNPLIFLGLGAVAFMAMGKKKPAPVENSFDSDDEIEDIEDIEEAGPVAQRFVATKLEPRKTTMFAKAAPLNYKATIAQSAALEAKQCHIQGMGGVRPITTCIANKLFPTWNWAPSDRSGWQIEAWSLMRDRASIELGLPTGV